jgi:hypothetical protein
VSTPFRPSRTHALDGRPPHADSRPPAAPRIRARTLDAPFDQQAPNAASPQLWLDKQRVEIRGAMSKQLYAQWATDHKGVERQFAAM